MATRGVAMQIPFIAWDTQNNVGKQGDTANIQMQWVKDGTLQLLADSTVTELSDTAVPGLYKVGITAVEAECDIGVLHGISASPNTSIIPVHIQFERLPNADPSAAGGVLDLQRIYGFSTAAERLAYQIDSVVSGLIQSSPAANQVVLQDIDQINAGLDVNNMVILITDENNNIRSQTRRITAYVPATRLATVDRDFDTDPTGGRYHILGLIL